MNRKLLTCLSLILTTSFLGACNEDLIETKAAEILLTHGDALMTKESGETATFSMALSADPGREVAIDILSSDLSEGVVEPSLVVLDESNWFVPITFTITGLSDGIVDGDIDYKITLSEKTDAVAAHPIKAVEVDVKNIDIDKELVVDPELASFVLSATDILTREAGPAADFSLVLGSAPTADVVVTLHVSDDSEGSVDKGTLTFSPENWRDPQMVKVNPLLDGIVDGDQDYVIEFDVSSTDKRYDDHGIGSIKVKNVDTDVESALFNLSVKDLLTREGGKTESFSLVLGAKPAADVVVALSVSDESEGSVDKNTLTFSPENWKNAQFVAVTPLKDDIVDGDQHYVIDFVVTSTDKNYDAYAIEALKVKNIDVDYVPGSELAIRVVAGNITSGNLQSYDEGHGIRIFQALKADIIMIQAFNMKKSTLRAMVNKTFGPEFNFTVGEGSIPNGVVTRFPIIEQGAWPSNVTSNRDWDWAVVDLPGPKDILVVSVHLNTKKHDVEMEPLKKKIQAKAAEGDYYVLLGGDFNTSNRTNTQRVFPPVLQVKEPYPVDQKGKGGTNAKRGKPYDWVLCCPAWAEFEVPVVIGSRSYPNGHVFDSRVYQNLNELGDVQPVQANDSGSANMQHMAVVRDFVFKY